MEECGKSGGGSRRSCTRAQAAPDWTSAETLTLISEISAVELECGNTVSSFQKWKTVSENCAAVGVHRSLDQCRRKWGSLYQVYTRIKELGSYWNLEEERRAELKVSEDFDLEIFRAMESHLNNNNNDDDKNEDEGEGSSDTETDEGAKTCPSDDVSDDDDVESNYEKKSNRLTVSSKKRNATVALAKENNNSNNNNNNNNNKKKKKKKKEPQIMSSVKLEEEEEEEEEELGEEGRLLGAKLIESARLVEAIVKDEPSEGVSETDFVRDQGDRLVESLGDLARTLEQLCDFVQL